MDLSIIVVCLSDPAVRAKALRALVAQIRDSVEILVVGRGFSEEERQSFDAVRWLDAPEAVNVPQMRQLAMQQSAGRIVALLEDDCVIAEGWIDAVIGAHGEEKQIIGGAIAAGAYQSLLDWAVYFCEYAPFVPPMSGLAGVLPGNNVSYPRALIDDYLSRAGDRGFLEVFEHAQWAQQGIALVAHPDMLVRNENHWGARHLVMVPCNHGRAFAGQRFSSNGKRLFYAACSLVLPLLRTLRMAQAIIKQKVYTRHFVMALPLILCFNSNWALGEFVGYLSGAGASADQWR